ncbi:lipoate--protein ligase family protein [Noviherbaspirillum sp.]|uniref:lipoate--protein ligase family protein n=1 Tax=Noviherbaspirillum sp. TaxID=1926288 RepID=UPI002B4A9D49|nr:ligase [Noviherbaspirillum sp.]HJV79541.1 ligase [Noviherbaspirillum sp.]
MYNAQQHREEQHWNQHKLSTEVRAPEARLWRYDKPAVILGRSQHAMMQTEAAIASAGIDVIARDAGGGAVLVGPWMLSASVVLPAAHPLVTLSTAKSYQWIGDVYASALAAIGVATQVLTPDEAHAWKQDNRASSIAWACFGGLSPGEVVIDGRKIVGFAQVRKRNGILLVAGLLLHKPDWTALCEAMGKPQQDAATLARCTTSCAEQLGRHVAAEDIADALELSLRQAIGADPD